MSSARLILILPLLSYLGFVAPAHALVQVPRLAARVTDQTGTLTASQLGEIEQRLQRFEAEKGAQISLLIVPTTNPETIEQYAIRVVEVWKIGRKGVDDGAMLVVAKNDRAVRIEVGYGLEGALPDITAKRIIEEVIVPRFKDGDFFGGISVGLNRIMKVIEGEPLPPPRKSGDSSASRPDSLMFIVIGAIIAGGILRSLLGRFIGAGIGGMLAGLLGWLLLGTLVFGGFIGLVVFIMIFFGIDSGGRSRGGFSSFGSSGGFGGGGGSFGGGGASGRW